MRMSKEAHHRVTSRQRSKPERYKHSPRQTRHERDLWRRLKGGLATPLSSGCACERTHTRYPRRETKQRPHLKVYSEHRASPSHGSILVKLSCMYASSSITRHACPYPAHPPCACGILAKLAHSRPASPATVNVSPHHMAYKWLWDNWSTGVYGEI